MNPENKDDFKRLKNTVRLSYRKMEPFREKRSDLVKAFTGSEYGGSKRAKTVYLNLLHLATQIYVRQLAVRAPKAKITCPYQKLKPLAYNLTLACEEAADETGLGLVLRRGVTDALFSPMAVVKLGLEYTGKEEYGSEEIDMTAPFVRNVSFDDYVQDMSARSAYKPSFMGDRYFITKDKFKKVYNKSIPKDERWNNESKPRGGSDSNRAENISHEPASGETSKFEDVVELQDIWIPDQEIFVTYFYSKSTDKPLRVIDDFDTSEKGPYRRLWFTGVPDNAMPMPPFGQVKDIHMVANNILRRLVYQAENHKRVTAFKNSEDAEKFNRTKDGHATTYDGVPPEDLEAGGIDQPSMAFFIQLKDLFSWSAGNLESLGGLSPMSETAKQDKMLLESASAQVRDMQDAATDFARSIFEQIAWYEWTDPIRRRTLKKEVPGTDIVIPVKWTPETRQADFLDFNFDIVPVSMRDELPEKKMQDIQAVLRQVVEPMMPFLQQQGMTIDVQRLIDIASDYVNLPELSQIIVPVSGESNNPELRPTGNPEPQTAGKPAETKRTYERVNRPGATRVGKDMALMQTLLGGNAQKSEKESIFRGVS